MDDFPPPSRRPLILVAVAIGAGLLFALLHLSFGLRVLLIVAAVVALAAWEVRRGE